MEMTKTAKINISREDTTTVEMVDVVGIMMEMMAAEIVPSWDIRSLLTIGQTVFLFHTVGISM